MSKAQHAGVFMYFLFFFRGYLPSCMHDDWHHELTLYETNCLIPFFQNKSLDVSCSLSPLVLLA
uniref:Predicted protein n=1 Tax=Hordeum vulgare subsp. vulgare TaxID=112509 RepID=F2D9F5_HORVV|nr:predicted protein [Hordeum vulgare subsp. vulgare]